MKKQKPIAGEFYRHFKGGLYQIKMLAKDSDSLKEKVVYQAMYAPFECWVRDLEELKDRTIMVAIGAYKKIMISTR